MANYLFLYRGGGRPETDEEGARVMAAWGTWMEGVGAAMVDGGNPVGAIATIAPDGSTSEGGGGVMPVSGYSVISADDMDAALALAKGCPVLDSGGSVEVCETFDVM